MSTGDSPSAQESIIVGRMRIRCLIDGTATGGMGVFELSVPPSSNVPPPHSHTANEECVYVLEGVLRYAVDDVARDLRLGTGCLRLVDLSISSVTHTVSSPGRSSS
jgi:uncharacterized cupin superfamily protein